jgi:hypothetical protein
MSAADKRVRRLGLFVEDELARYTLLKSDAYKAYYALRFRAVAGVPGHADLPEGFLPDDEQLLQQASGLDCEAWGAVSATVLGLFTKMRRGKRAVYRSDADVESIELSRRRAGVGKTGGEAKALAKPVANEDASGQATGVANRVAKRVAKGPATGVAKRAAKAAANEVARGLPKPEAKPRANGVASPLANDVANPVAKGVAPTPSPFSQTGVEDAAPAEAEDGSRRSLEIPPRTPGFPHLQHPDDDTRARGMAAAAGGGVS